MCRVATKTASLWWTIEYYLTRTDPPFNDNETRERKTQIQFQLYSEPVFSTECPNHLHRPKYYICVCLSFSFMAGWLLRRTLHSSDAPTWSGHKNVLRQKKYTIFECVIHPLTAIESIIFCFFVSIQSVSQDAIVQSYRSSIPIQKYFR